MGITANTPRPKPARNQNGGCGTLFFLLIILLGPGRGIVQGLLPGLSNSEYFALAIGVIALVALVTAVRSAAGSRPGGTPAPGLPRSSWPTVPANAPTMPQPPRLPQSRPMDLPGAAPRFEPYITGKVMLAGLILLLGFAGAFFVLWVNLNL